MLVGHNKNIKNKIERRIKLKKIKILQIVDNLSIESGVSSVVINYFNNLLKEKIEYTFLVSEKKDKSYEDHIINNNGKIIYLEQKLCPTNYRKVYKEVCDFFKRNEFDIVELHSPNYAFIYMKAAFKYNIKIRIIHAHSSIFSKSKVKSIIGKILNFNAKRYANQLFACSDFAADYWFGKRYFIKNKGQIIYNAIDLNRFIILSKEEKEKLKEQFNIPKGKKIIGTISRISKEKNIDFLVDMMHKICKKNDNIILLIVGEGNESNRIKYKVHKKGLESKVIFLGHRDNIFEILQIFDIFVLASKREGLPVTAVEAQIAGVPCIVSDTITKQLKINRIYFEKLNKKIWIKKIKEIINSKENDKNLKEDTLFNIKNASKEMWKIYENLFKIGEKKDKL